MADHDYEGTANDLIEAGLIQAENRRKSRLELRAARARRKKKGRLAAEQRKAEKRARLDYEAAHLRCSRRAIAQSVIRRRRFKNRLGSRPHPRYSTKAMV